ncbi:MAG: hypothetical protein FJW27_09100 [Acidimicrobiia bacterium]|nr:hypothetical protein [Acidimicrobiia bacterium]
MSRLSTARTARRRGAERVAILAVCGVVASGCGAARQHLPSGPGEPAPDAASAFGAAVTACRNVTSLTAEMAVRGTAAGQRLRGRVLVGVAAPASALLDAAAPFGASLFIYAAHEGDATLLLPRDQRVLPHGDPASVLEAVAGVPLDPTDLRRTLTGCTVEGEPQSGRAFGASWRLVTVNGDEAYVRRANGVWRLVALVHHGSGGRGWRADYADFQGDLPRTIRLTSADDARRFDLHLRLSQVEVNPTLGTEVFALRVPPTLSPISLEELRQAGPMGEAPR